MSLDKFIKEGCIFICGENENLNQHALNTLLMQDLKHLYFVNPATQTREYLKRVASDKKYSIVASFSEIDFWKENLLITGFKPISETGKSLKEYPGQVDIFFSENIGVFKGYWEGLRINKLTIYETSLNEYIEKSYQDEYSLSPVPKENNIDVFFTNRGKELEQHREFINRNYQRCCAIIGWNGIGKKSFIRKLKTSQGIGTNCIEFTFVNKHDDISFLLTGLMRKLGLPFDKDEVEGIRISRNYYPDLLRGLFEEIDKKENLRLIFYQFHEIYDLRKKQFYDSQIAHFFHHLLNRESFKGNRIYIVSNENFILTSPQDRDFLYKISLDPLHAQQIKLILEHEFNSRSRNQFAIAIMKYDHKTIDELLNGHPQIAKLLVEACEHYPLEQIVNDEAFRNKFIQEKVLYLMRYVHLEKEDKERLKNNLPVCW